MPLLYLLCVCVQVPFLQNSPLPFAHLSFSNDGKRLVAVHEDKILILDAFSGGHLLLSDWCLRAWQPRRPFGAAISKISVTSTGEGKMGMLSPPLREGVCVCVCVCVCEGGGGLQCPLACDSLLQQMVALFTCL